MLDSTWNGTLALRPAHEQAAVSLFVAQLEMTGAFGHYTIRNLAADRFINGPAIEEFIDLFLRYSPLAPTTNFITLWDEYISLCHRFALCGAEIRCRVVLLALGVHWRRLEAAVANCALNITAICSTPRRWSAGASNLAFYYPK